MTHFEIMVEGAHAEVIDRNGILTSGMVGATVEFEFDSSWDGLLKTAVFKSANISRKRVGIESLTEIPYEVLRKSGYKLNVGVYGYRADGKVVIPTVWVDLGRIQAGTDADCDPSAEPTPNEVEQMMAYAQAAVEAAEAAQKAAESCGNANISTEETKAYIRATIVEVLQEMGVLTSSSVAADTEAEDMISEVFGSTDTGSGGDTSGDDTPTDGDETESDTPVTDGEVATDDEVDDLLEDIFGA